MVEAHSSVSDLHAIFAAYEQIDRQLEAIQGTEERAGEEAARELPVFEIRQINEQAYFLLAWGQMEVDIDDSCRDAIRHGQSQADWRDRRAWSLHNPEDRRLSGLSFENRLSLVLEKGSAERKEVMRLYNLRNQIAHGSLHPDGVDTRDVIRVLFRIRSMLARK